MSTYHYIACDLGAESGRVMLSTLADGKLTLEEIHRFPTGGNHIGGTYRWDVLRIFEELKAGLRKVAARGLNVASVSTDSWGVDYVWLKGDEPMFTLPYHYRDERTDGGFKRAFAVVKADEIFAETGIQFMTLNTLYQLHADLRERPWVMKQADKFLHIADYFNYLFSGVAKVEESLASTSQIYNPVTKTWSAKLIRKFGFPKKAFPPVVPSGTKLGKLAPEIIRETNLEPIQVVASCSHDTGAAVAAVPGQGDNWAYLSSGTWSLLGIEADAPIITAKSRKFNWTNEVGFGSSIRFLKNIVGLWIIQECKRTWAKEGQPFSYDQLIEMGQQAESLKSLINPGDPRFAKPNDMPKKITDYCRETKQPVPATTGEYVRCIYQSLALAYRARIEELENVTGRNIEVLHVVGGGSQNALLSQQTANAIQRTVHCGPVEGTAIGNMLIQAIAMGHLKGLAELRQVVRQSFPLKTYTPQDSLTWQKAYERFQKLP